MQNFLNRRMFTTPIRAAEGTYVPTIEQILNFYTGGFDDTGTPLDIEAFQAAVANAGAANEAGLFPGEGKPIDPYLYFGKNVKDFAKDQGIDTVIDPIGGYFANNFKPGDNEKDFLSTYLATDEVPGSERMIKEQIQMEKEQVEDDYAQRQLDVANQKELFEELKNTGIKNLAGDTTQPITGDDNIELIKRNILQGTNVVERGTPDYMSLSAVEKMKVDDATSKKRKEDLDLTEVSEKRLKNFIDAAGDSAETAILIYNDMKNAGGEIAEAADEVLQGWKDAFSKGFDDDQKKSLNEQLEYLKSSDSDKEKSLGVGPPIFGVDMETLKKGGENIKEWYKDTIFPEAIEGGVDIIQNIFGAQDLGDGTLPADQQTGTVAPTVDPRKQSGLSEEQDKEIDLADRPPSIVEDVSFKTKVDETKNKVIETVDEIKETVIEKFPEIKDKVTEKIEVLKEKVKNNSITEGEFVEKINEIKNTTLEKIDDLDIKNKVVDLFDETVKKTKDFFTKKEKPSELDNITAGVSEEGDKKVDLASRADVETPIKDEEVKEIDETITADKDTVTSGSEGAGTVAANESSGSGSGAFTTTNSDGSLNVQGMIDETAKQTGYNFKGLDDTKDDLALKTMMYGLKLFLTPGSFSEAAGKVAQEALTNEINQRYKTKAAQAKFRGEMFKTILAGKMDIEKELAKLRGKKTDFKTVDYGAKNLNSTVAGWISQNLGVDLDLEFEDGIPKDRTDASFVFFTNFKNEVQKLGNQRKTEGSEDPSLDDELLIEAYNNLSGDFKVTKAELNIIDKTFNYITGKSDKEIEDQRIAEGTIGTSDQYKRKLADATNAKIITEVMIDNAIKQNPGLSLTREDVIKALKNDPTFKDWDYSRVV